MNLRVGHGLEFDVVVDEVVDGDAVVPVTFQQKLELIQRLQLQDGEGASPNLLPLLGFKIVPVKKSKII